MTTSIEEIKENEPYSIVIDSNMNIYKVKEKNNAKMF